MPHVRIETRKGWLGSRRADLFDAIHSAMVDALKIPRDDRVLRLVEHEPDNFPTPPSKTDKFTIVEITMFAGRSLMASVSSTPQLFAISRLSASLRPTSTSFFMNPPLENWGIRGGVPASEVDLGFQVRV